MASPPPGLLFFAALLAFAVASTVRNGSSAAPTALEVTLGVLLPERNLTYPWAWPRVAPALGLALEALEPRLRPAGLAFRPAFASTEAESGACSEDPAWGNLFKLQESDRPDVLLGPGCDHVAFSLGELVSRWGLPFLTAGAFNAAVSDKAPYGKMVNVGPAGPALGAFLAGLHRGFNWTSRAALLVYLYTDVFYLCTASLQKAAEQLRADAPNFTVQPHAYSQPEEAVRLSQQSGRVVHICGPVEMLHGIMRLAQDHSMTEGDYVFIYVDLLGESLRAEGHREAAKPWQSKESQDAGGLREAFRSVLVITAHEPQTPEYRRFQSQLIQRAQRDFGVELKESLENLVAGSFHDGLLLYAMALNETLHEGGTKRNTSRILDKMRSRRFQGITGSVIMNSDGEREGDFDLWTMADVESGEYQVVGHYMASEKQIKWTGPIHWKKGRPPLDNPPCVFNMDDPSCVRSKYPPYMTWLGGMRFFRAPDICTLTESCTHHCLQIFCRTRASILLLSSWPLITDLAKGVLEWPHSGLSS